MNKPNELYQTGPTKLMPGEKLVNKDTSQMLQALAAPRPVPVVNHAGKRYIVGVDFDGTVVTHEYPKIGKEIPHAAEVLKMLVNSNCDLILYTMRHGNTLLEAIDWFQAREIPLWGINKNPTQDRWSLSPKVYCNLYIDDAALGCPLKFDTDVSDRPFVDWVEVDKLLQKMNLYIEPIKDR